MKEAKINEENYQNSCSLNGTLLTLRKWLNSNMPTHLKNVFEWHGDMTL